jgi:hypothetical protein
MLKVTLLLVMSGASGVVFLGCDENPEAPGAGGVGGGINRKSIARSSAALEANLKGKRIYFRGKDMSHHGWVQFNTDGTAAAHGREGERLTFKAHEMTVSLVDSQTNSVDMVFTKSMVVKGDELRVQEQDEGSVIVVERVEPARFKPSVKAMKEMAQSPVSDEELPFVGRWVETDPDDPEYRSEIIWRVDHTYSVMFLSPGVDDKGNVIKGKYIRDLSHGIWGAKGNHLYFVDLIAYGDQKLPDEELRVTDAVLTKHGEDGYVFEQYEEGDRFKTVGKPLKTFSQEEMKVFNKDEALKGFDMQKALKEAKEKKPAQPKNPPIPVEPQKEK